MLIPMGSRPTWPSCESARLAQPSSPLHQPSDVQLTRFAVDVFGNADLVEAILWNESRAQVALAVARVETALALGCTCTVARAPVWLALARGPRMFGWSSPSLCVERLKQTHLHDVLVVLLSRVPVLASLFVAEELDSRAALVVKSTLLQRAAACRLQMLHLKYCAITVPTGSLRWLAEAVPRLRCLELDIGGQRLESTVAALRARSPTCQLERLSLSGIVLTNASSCLTAMGALLVSGLPNLSCLTLSASTGADVDEFSGDPIEYATGLSPVRLSSLSVELIVYLGRDLTEPIARDVADAFVAYSRARDLRAELHCNGWQEVPFAAVCQLSDAIIDGNHRDDGSRGRALEVTAQGRHDEHNIGWYEEWEFSSSSSSTRLSDIPSAAFATVLVDSVIISHVS